MITSLLAFSFNSSIPKAKSKCKTSKSAVGRTNVSHKAKNSSYTSGHSPISSWKHSRWRSSWREQVVLCFNAHFRPPEPGVGIAGEQEWGIDLRSDSAKGINEDGSTWWRKSGEDLGDDGYRCRWTVMGGKSGDNRAEWTETWWEKVDYSGYKELGAEKSGCNGLGDTWWETWKEVFWHDDVNNISFIEKSADKWARDGTAREWNERWSDKCNSTGWTEKGAIKTGRNGPQSWTERWGEVYDGLGGWKKWTEKWAESGASVKWGDKWDENFKADLTGTKQGETWRVGSNGERWSRTWGEIHEPDGTARKYGTSTSGENWDITSNEPTSAEQGYPQYGWHEVLENTFQLLSIPTPERPDQ